MLILSPEKKKSQPSIFLVPRSQIGAVWLKNLLQIHAGLLLSNPELPELLGPTVGSIQNRLSLHMPLGSLRGRLDLLASQISSSTDSKDQSQDDRPMIYYNDGMARFS